MAFEKRRDRFVSTSVKPAGFVPLRGPHARPATSVRAGDWWASLDDGIDGAAQTLLSVMAIAPQTEAVVAPPRGWFTSVAMDDPAAIWASHCNDWHLQRIGIFLPEERSLAVLEWRRGSDQQVQLLSFGAGGALERLREHLARAAPLDLQRLGIEANPAGSSVEPRGVAAAQVPGEPGRWMLTRPAFTYVVRYRADPTP